MKKIFYITTFLAFALVTSCISQKKSSKLVLVKRPQLENPGELIGSLIQEVSQRYGNYLYYYDGIGDVTYIIFKDTSLALYKINTEAIYYYNSPFWSCPHFKYLSETANILKNDSIKPTEADNGVFISHAERFTLKCRIRDEEYRRSGPYYLLRKEQILFFLIAGIERSLLSAEQDEYYWKKIK